MSRGYTSIFLFILFFYQGALLLKITPSITHAQCLCSVGILLWLGQRNLFLGSEDRFLAEQVFTAKNSLQD
jgi:hypothetical protein